MKIEITVGSSVGDALSAFQTIMNTPVMKFSEKISNFVEDWIEEPYERDYTFTQFLDAIEDEYMRAEFFSEMMDRLRGELE